MGRKQDQVMHDFVVGRFVELRRAAYLMCGDWQLAEDLVRLTMARIVAGRRRRPRNLDALARRALMNAFRTGWRGSFRRRERLFSAIGAPPPDTPGQRLEGGHDPVVKASVLAALHQLPPRRRAVVVLHHWENLSLQETAATLNISPSAVRAHSAAGVAALRSVVGDLLPAPDPAAADAAAAVAVPAGGRR